MIFAVLLVLVLAVLGVHECGHLIAGTIHGFKCHLFVVGPLALRRKDGKLQSGWNRSLWLAGGAVSMLPTDGRDLVRRVGWMVAGGPLASLVLALGGMGAHWMLGGAPTSRLFWFTGICSAAIFVATGIPMRLRHHTDGARLLMLWKGGPAAEEWCGQLLSFGASAAR